MKKNVLFLWGLLGVSACQSPQQEASLQQEAAVEPVASAASDQVLAYGERVDSAAPVAVEEVPALLARQDSLYTTLRATALESCAKKGCWMTVALGNGESMRVTFKDYGFFVPKNLKGEQVVMQGVLKRKLSTVEELRHYAEDAGKSAAEVAAIQQADTAYSFEAAGVLIWPLQK